MKKTNSLKLVKILSLLTFVGLMSSCSNEAPSPRAQLQDKLFKVAQMNGCIVCHTVSATVVGPSWKAVAERYKDADLETARALLIESIKKGSKGKYYTWKGGDGMPPLENRVSSEAIEELVDLILGLR